MSEQVVKTKVTNVFPGYIKGFNAQYFVGPADQGGKALIVLLTPVDQPQKMRMEAMGKPYIRAEQRLHPDAAIAYAAGDESVVEVPAARAMYAALSTAYKAGVIDG